MYDRIEHVSQWRGRFIVLTNRDTSVARFNVSTFIARDVAQLIRINYIWPRLAQAPLYSFCPRTNSKDAFLFVCRSRLIHRSFLPEKKQWKW